MCARQGKTLEPSSRLHSPCLLRIKNPVCTGFFPAFYCKKSFDHFKLFFFSLEDKGTVLEDTGTVPMSSISMFSHISNTICCIDVAIIKFTFI